MLGTMSPVLVQRIQHAIPRPQPPTNARVMMTKSPTFKRIQESDDGFCPVAPRLIRGETLQTEAQNRHLTSAIDSGIHP